MIKVLRGATLIDGTGAAPLPNSVIVIEGERIQRVGPAVDFGSQTPGGEQNVVDVSGSYVIPGMINCHEHLDNRRGFGSFQQRAAQDPLYLILRSARNALLSLQEGVTTVRDLASKQCTNLIIKQAINDGMIVGPRVFACGTAIAMTGGHGDEICLVADGVDEVRKAARTLLRAGADIIKVMGSGGYVTQGRDLPFSSQLTIEEMRAAFDEAHRAGKPTTVHAHPSPAVRAAIEAGVDCIEHGALLDLETAELMASKGVFLVPTASESWMMAEHGVVWGRPKWLVESDRAHLGPRMEVLKQCVRGGPKIAVGSDVIGDMVREMLLLVEAGMTPMQAIEAATRVGAEVLCQQNDLGTVEPGKFADLVIVDGDPLVDLNALRNIKMVYKGGKAYDPQALAAASGKWPL